MYLMEQLSLFDMFPLKDTAISCMSGEPAPIGSPAPWVKTLIPEAEYVVEIGTHHLALRRTKLAASRVPKGHEFYHYLVGDIVYAGVFVEERPRSVEEDAV